MECGGKRSATALWIDPMIQSAVVVPTTRDYADALQKLSPAPRVLSIVTDRNPGAHAPTFMSSCATRTGLLKNRKIAGLTLDPIQGMGLNYCQK